VAELKFVQKFLRDEPGVRDDRWSEAIAVGS